MIVTVILLTVAVVAIILFHFMRKPQVKLVEAMANTVSSSQRSDLNKRYGTYDIMQNIVKGNLNFSFNDIEDDKNVDIELLRSAENHKFLAETAIDDRSFKLYVNKKTSLIYINDMAVRIQYMDNLITNMSNSSVVSVLGLDNETVYAFGKAYESCMRLAADNYVDENGNVINSDVLEKTLKYFLDMKGSYEGRKDIIVGDKSDNKENKIEKCKVYSVVFDVDDFYNYLDDCFGGHDIDLNEVYDSLSKYMPDIETIDNAAVMVHDIKQFVDDILDGKDITFYFAINKDKELVTLYADNISDKNISVDLSFKGYDYIAGSYELSVQTSKGLFEFSKTDVKKDDSIGVSYRADISPAIDSDSIIVENIGDISAGLDVVFSGENADIDIKVGNSEIKKEATLSACEKGRSMDFTWTQDEAGDIHTGGLHIGSDPGDIKKPEYSESIDPFDTDIISVYKFMKKIMEMRDE